MTTQPTPPRNTVTRTYLGDDHTPWYGFHQGTPSIVGDQWFALYLDTAQLTAGVELILTPTAVLALAKQLDDMRDDAEAVLHDEAVTEGREAA